MYTKKVNNGYFATTVTYDKRLKYCPYGSCGVVELYDGTIRLVSYTTVVCELTVDGWLTCTGTYSATTRKHIGAFMREYGRGLGYESAKQCYINNYRFNLISGEIQPL